MEPLLECSAKKLLEKFGMGSHKPGSGSAAAFEGMLAAQLIHTVIGLSNEDKHKEKYKDSLPELLRNDNDIMKRIYPSLEILFQKDAILFDEVIQLRRQRDNEKDPIKKDELKKGALAALKPATEILIEIADYCADLADYAAFNFDKAFQPAKGDSSVVLYGAVAALAGCLSVIDLNLASFGIDEWTVKIREQVSRLRADHKNLDQESKNRAEKFTLESLRKSFKLATNDINSGRWEGVVNQSTIESVADNVTNFLWDFRDFIWDGSAPKHPYEILKPEIVIEKILGYQFRYESLGIDKEGDITFQIAGQINKKEKMVVISKDLSPEVKNYTAAHELGHALLHSDIGILHRDRPLDGSGGITEVKERQADTFAACFLMPRETVRAVFNNLFSVPKLVVDRDTVFRLTQSDLNEFKKKHKNLRAFAAFVAKYEGKDFQPLHRIFGVSVMAMAIRLEELGLVEYYI